MPFSKMPLFDQNMETLSLHPIRSILTSRLSRQLGLWVFSGILVVEAMIFLPSAYRRKYEQLEIIQMTAEATVNTLAITAPESARFIDRLAALSQNTPLMGAALYRADGGLVNQFGSVINLHFEPGQSRQSQLRYTSPWRYEIALSVTLQDGPHYLLLAYNATAVTQDLVAFSLRVSGLILLISVSVTILMMWIISRRLINPILLLRSDIDIHQGLESCLLLLQSRLLPTPLRAAIVVQQNYGDLPPVRCYPKQLNQVFMSLMTNAIEALDRQASESPLITITTACFADFGADGWGQTHQPNFTSTHRGWTSLRDCSVHRGNLHHQGR
jgi:signal transduction histidine kinase